MSKIIIDAREYTTTTGRYVFRLIQYLEKLDHDNDYAVLLKPSDMEIYDFTNPRFTKIATPHKEFTFAEQIGLKRQLESLKPDLVHFGMVQQPIRYKGKVVTTIHDLTTLRFKNPTKNALAFTLKQQVYKWVIKRAARKSNAIFTPSQFTKDDVVKFTGVDPTKITVTHLAADPITEAAQPVTGLEKSQFIIYVGRPLPHKNLDRLIEAFDRLKANHPTLKLVLAGKKDALYERYEADVKAKGLRGVVFTDFVSEGRLRWLYEHCAAYVFPSLSEGFGLPGLEAMVHGAPVVSSNATCLPEIYGEAAHYFDPTNVQAMADAISEVLTDKNLRAELIAKGQAQAAKYSWQRTAEQTLAVYNKVI